MKLRAVIPFRPENPKTRLSGIMSEEERKSFADAMLHDVVSALQSAGISVTILSTADYDFPSVPVLVRNEGLNEALNWYLPQEDTPVLIVMSDLPLITKASIEKAVSAAADIGIVPGLGGGTNILFIKEPKRYRVQYYGFSFKRHIDIAESLGMSVEILDSMRMSTDIDEPADLTELIIHGTGCAAAWLASHGFILSAESGRVCVKRGGKDLA